MPVTNPVDDPIVAFALLIDQVPAEVISDNKVVNPVQTLSVPPIAVGTGLIVIVAKDLQPVVNVYVIVANPEVTPVTRPVDELMVALVLLISPCSAACGICKSHCAANTYT
jgi:hypothetical protein